MRMAGAGRAPAIRETTIMEQNQTCEPTLKVVEIKHAAVHAVESRELLRDGRQLVILHGGQRYLLRQTRDNKLILTK